MRTFTFSDSKSHKFWNIDVQGTKFIVTYGKIGTAGQTSEKEWPSDAKCQAEADKLIKEKTGKGYVETTPQANVGEQEAFEKTLMLHPDDRTAWSAYADYLTEKGDPRGEFMMVQLALEDESVAKKEREALKEREKALIAAHEREWLGTLLPYTLDYVKNEDSWRDQQIRYTFTRGWITELNIDEITVNIARACAKNPNLRFLKSLSIRSDDYDDKFEAGPDVPKDVERNSAGYHALTRCPHLANLRKFSLGNGHSTDNNSDPFIDADQCHTSGEVVYHLVKQMPLIEELVLLAHRVDTRKIFALPMPELRFLQVDHATSYPLDVLATNKSITKLTHLVCWPHAIDYDNDEDDDEGEGGVKAYIRLKHLKAICKANWPDFKFLRLRCTDFGDDGAKEIVSSGILKRLKHLDLDNGCITETGASLLAGSPDLKNLDTLSLHYNAIQGSGTEAILKVLPKANVKGQHDQIPPFNNDTPEFLFMGDIE
ncbi:MAG: WGR domain-containing protein [Fimbriiglobus sp.]